MRQLQLFTIILVWGISLILQCNSSKAGLITINLAGWQAFGPLGPGSGNTDLTVNIGAGSTITNVSYSNLNITAEGQSFLSDFTISLNDSNLGQFWDFNPFVGSNAPGTSSTVNGVFPNPGLFGSGPFQVLPNGLLYITTYDFIDDNAGRESLVNSGTLTIEYISAVPEPSTYAMMGLAMTVGGGFAARRRWKKAQA